jgi:molybdate transport system substrate-binding protein
MKITPTALVLIAVAMFGTASCEKAAPTARAQLRVAAAASVRFAIEDIGTAFEQSNPNVDVVVTSGASGTFVAQISQGAPFDVFFSADTSYPTRLQAEGLGVEPVIVYARGTLVLWSRDGKQPTGFESIEEPDVKHIAIANPEIAPYGRAAKQAMQMADVWDSAQPRLVQGENVEQAAQFVVGGGAELAFVPLSLAKRETGEYWVLPAETYDPIEHACVVVKSSSNPELAAAFREFVASPIGREVLQQHGFTAPE